MKKNIVIDGDKFQKEYKKQFQKEMITDLVQGILLLIIAITGLFGSKLLLKLFIYIFPLFILTYAINLFSMGLSIIKTRQSQGISFFIQSIIFAAFAIYIFLNPINTVNYILIMIGAFIITNAIIKMIYFPNYIPVGSLVCGFLLIVFSEFFIEFFYSIIMIFLLIYGTSKISKAIYTMKNN